MAEPRILARACRTCRHRKTKCDIQKPQCGSCMTYNRHCVYALEPPKKRPSAVLVNALAEEKATLERCLVQLKLASREEREERLEALVVTDGKVDLSSCVFANTATTNTTAATTFTPQTNTQQSPIPNSDHSLSAQAVQEGESVDPRDAATHSDDDDSFQPSNYLSVDERGQVEVYGPTSALHGLSPDSPVHNRSSQPSDHPLRHQLIVNALMQRQKEYNLLRLQTIGGEPAELALHLLELHWNRQHHTFLLTYRPAIMRDLVTGGPNCSPFLLNAIFACVSKFSDRLEVRDNPAEPETTGARFFARCEALLLSESLLTTSSIPTMIGLLLLGSTFNAQGKASRGWLYTGYALRMVYDLGLHLDFKAVGGNAEDVEIRRRVFWGAFICDKLQSLYLGRPVTFQECDARVSRDFMDTMEENELWMPYVDPKTPSQNVSATPPLPTPVYSVSTFQQLCLLSKIMAKIINRFYVIGATFDNTHEYLQAADDSLAAWYAALPPHLLFEPWAKDSPSSPSHTRVTTAAPNVMLLLTTYNSLVILLHRPFVFGHLRQSSIPAASWKRCTTAARNITTIASTYQASYTLRQAPYLLSYAVYVACTIHTRNTVASEGQRVEENLSALLASLRCLDELTVPNSGVLSPASNIRKLMAANGISNILDNTWDVQTPNSQQLEALCQIFPPMPTNTTESMTEQVCNEYLPYGYDDFNGLMTLYMPNFNGFLLDTENNGKHRGNEVTN